VNRTARHRPFAVDPSEPTVCVCSRLLGYATGVVDQMPTETDAGRLPRKITRVLTEQLGTAGCLKADQAARGILGSSRPTTARTTPETRESRARSAGCRTHRRLDAAPANRIRYQYRRGRTRCHRRSHGLDRALAANPSQTRGIVNPLLLDIPEPSNL